LTFVEKLHVLEVIFYSITTVVVVVVWRPDQEYHKYIFQLTVKNNKTDIQEEVSYLNTFGPRGVQVNTIGN